jgi:hypothetical protein
MIELTVLNITTWKDSPLVFGQHYYGTLKARDREDERVEFELSKKEADELNKNLSSMDIEIGASYSVGELTGRFLSREHLLESAINRHSELVKEGWPELLMEGDLSILDPQYCLIHPDGKKKKKLNKIVDRFEAFDGWACKKDQEAQVEAICDEWESLLYSTPVNGEA